LNSDLFFTSDLHIGHEAILRYTDRGKYWNNIDDHDRDIINIVNWTTLTSSHLYIVGDLAMGNKWRAADHVSRLCAKHKHLVLGNHDEALEDFWRSTGLFTTVTTRMKFKYHEQFIVLDHHPSLAWDRAHHGSWQLHGHTHGDLDHAKFNMDPYRIFDVGFDASPKYDTGYGYDPEHHGYKPFSFTWLNEHLSSKVKLSHHGERRE
jgi:calcineurin-like phosphoesterase family protein